MSNLEAIVSIIARSKKYHAICEDTIRRLAERELARHGNLRLATKATKRRLHQVYGAFEHDFDDDVLYRRLESAYKTGSEAEIKAACRYALGLHSSTRERLPILDRFFSATFEVTGQPSSMLDVGCGLNPLALPWMGLIAGARYVALDIDANRVRFLNRYLCLAGFEPLARCQDVLSHPPHDQADVALLLKMGPTLERQEQGATLRLVEQLQTRFVVVSFAVQSLGGREKGMREHYEQQFLDLVRDQPWGVQKRVHDTEMVLILGPFL